MKTPYPKDFHDALLVIGNAKNDAWVKLAVIMMMESYDQAGVLDDAIKEADETNGGLSPKEMLKLGAVIAAKGIQHYANTINGDDNGGDEEHSYH